MFNGMQGPRNRHTHLFSILMTCISIRIVVNKFRPNLCFSILSKIKTSFDFYCF